MGTGKKDPPPFERHGRKLIGENTRFRIYFDHIVARDQVAVPEYLVVVPKLQTRDGITGVGILPVLGDKIVLLKIYRHPVETWSWEIPRGFVDSDEGALESVARELNEETGLRCSKNKIQELGCIDADAGILSARIKLFAGLDCEVERPFAPDEMGHLEMKTFEVREVFDLIGKSEMRDPSSLVAFYRYTNMING